jgi:hypothetical protein
MRVRTELDVNWLKPRITTYKNDKVVSYTYDSTTLNQHANDFWQKWFSLALTQLETFEVRDNTV